jgi:protein HIRA/HIR1
VFIAAVITRNTWTSDISLVGHENTVEVAAYNPHIFLRNPAVPVTTSNICSVVALGADDRSVSVWQTKSARPLIVAKEVFDRHIMDLSWSWDGLTLYAASSDGTIAAFAFTAEELEGIAPHSVQEQYLSKFGFSLPPAPHGYSHGSANQITPPPSPTRRPAEIEVPKTVVNGEQVNQLVARRGKPKKRATLMPPTSAIIPSAGSGAQLPPTSRAYPSISANAPSFGFPRPAEQPYEPQHNWARHDLAPMDLDMPMDSFGDGGISRGKRKASAMLDGEDGGPAPKGRTMGEGRKQEASGPVKQLKWGTTEPAQSISIHHLGSVLPTLPLLSYSKSEIEESDSYLEVRNKEEDRKFRLILFHFQLN